jgi:hypothetical protein
VEILFAFVVHSRSVWPARILIAVAGFSGSADEDLKVFCFFSSENKTSLKPTLPVPSPEISPGVAISKPQDPAPAKGPAPH